MANTDDDDVIDSSDDTVSQLLQFLTGKLNSNDVTTVEGLVSNLLGVASDEAGVAEGAKRLGLARPMKVVGDSALRARVNAGLARKAASDAEAFAKRFPGALAPKRR